MKKNFLTSNVLNTFQIMRVVSLTLLLGATTVQSQAIQTLECRPNCSQQHPNPGYDRCKQKLGCHNNLPVEKNPCKQQCNKENPNPAYFTCVIKNCGISIPSEIVNPNATPSLNQ